MLDMFQKHEFAEEIELPSIIVSSSSRSGLSNSTLNLNNRLVRVHYIIEMRQPDKYSIYHINILLYMLLLFNLPNIIVNIFIFNSLYTP